MSKLYLVGITEDRTGLVLARSPRAKSGDDVLEVDPAVLEAIAEVRRFRAEGGGTPTVSSPALPVRRGEQAGGGGRDASRLTPREIQSRLRRGESVPSVARRAGVEEWRVEIYAAPIVAEQARVIGKARQLVLDKRGSGPSGRPLGEAVLAGVVEKGVSMYAQEFETAWSAYEPEPDRWVVRFRYVSRGREQVAEWYYDPAEETVTAANRLGTALGWRDPKRPGRIPPLPEAPAGGTNEGTQRGKPSSRKKTSAKKTAATKKAATKKSGGKPSATKKAATKKSGDKPSTTKTTAAKTTGAKKTAAKTTGAKKTGAKKAAPEKPGASPSGASTSRAKNTSRAKKAGDSKKTPPKKTPPEKASAKPSATEPATPTKTAAKKTSAKKASGKNTGATKTGSKSTGSKSTGSKSKGSKNTGAKSKGSKSKGSKSTATKPASAKGPAPKQSPPARSSARTTTAEKPAPRQPSSTRRAPEQAAGTPSETATPSPSPGPPAPPRTAPPTVRRLDPDEVARRDEDARPAGDRPSWRDELERRRAQERALEARGPRPDGDTPTPVDANLDETAGLDVPAWLGRRAARDHADDAADHGHGDAPSTGDSRPAANGRGIAVDATPVSAAGAGRTAPPQRRRRPLRAR